MRYKTAFRLAVRLLGVLLFFYYLPWAIQSTCWMIEYAIDTSGTVVFRSWQIPGALSNLLGIGAGLYLFFGGQWIVNKAIPSNRPYCHECAYELTGLPATGNCPECGTAYVRPTGKPTEGQV